uniref:Solute carrier family 25 member 44 n=1 Tax=Rhodosorus marinus TaxID=101924 RepID=A0A7S3ENF5_9RHOD|mmetsp:Transcript_8208/g.36613  ORF Transcript_8208/g.36613 Transcript_8208/m.36613 type:complete len:318 (+) Transcript_8208:322-1275(+)
MDLDRNVADVDWEALDKAKFFTSGLFLFSGATTLLYPLSVIKTRQMVLDDPSGHRTGLRGSYYTSKTILQTNGILGFYRGIGTVIFGAIPARVLYLSTLEAAKSSIGKIIEGIGLSSDAAAAGMTSFLAGGVASLSSQAIVVPVDVVSQRLMVSTRAQGKTHGGLQEVRKLLAADGFKGLYRGFGISLMTYVPSSAVWWSAYAAYKEIFFQSVFGPKGSSRRENVGDESQPNSVNNESPSNESNGLQPKGTSILALQTLSALCAGLTSGFLTNPLDVVKTRLQVGPHNSNVDGILTVFYGYGRTPMARSRSCSDAFM